MSADDRTRYQQQSIHIRELVAYFDANPVPEGANPAVDEVLKDPAVTHMMEKAFFQIDSCISLRVDTSVWIATRGFAKRIGARNGNGRGWNAENTGMSDNVMLTSGLI